MNDLPMQAEVVLNTGARTPEELEVLLEDTLLLRDPQALAGLFEAGAVLVASDNRWARGGEAIARLALAAWEVGHNYLAKPQGVTQARDIALIVGEQALNVVRRGSDGIWRYVLIRQNDADRI